MLLSIEWKVGKVRFIDQSLLPAKLEYVETTDYKRLIGAIRRMEVRGAPLIGITAAFALALATFHDKSVKPASALTTLRHVGEELRAARPTGQNLFWAIDRILHSAELASKGGKDVRSAVTEEALRMAKEDLDGNKMIGNFGAELLKDGDSVMTICNAGGLATVGYGTALGVVRAAVEAGKKIRVIVPETRPKLQGSRLTSWELMQDGIPVTLIPDTAVGYVLQRKMVDKIVVGADRILRDGTVFNKIGSYSMAVVARVKSIPFYVAAPFSTFDLKSEASGVKIEERSRDEVVRVGAEMIAPEGVEVLNPAFDMVPPNLVSGLITEKGVILPPLEKHIASALGTPHRSTAR
jgi:methylthioribose-1-phosphate isomerase